MAITRRTCSGLPYQYNMKTKKRVVAVREGLTSDEEEVDDLLDMDHIEEIICMTYERNMKGT
jgi:hypothetical protein